jgi:hypothetical protein
LAASSLVRRSQASGPQPHLADSKQQDCEVTHHVSWRRARKRNAPSADRIVCRGRAGERVAPPRASPLGWPSADGTGHRGRRGGRAGYKPGWDLDPHRLLPVEPTNPGQRTVPSASLAWRALCLLADAPMLPGWNAAARGHWTQLPRDPWLLPHRAGSATPSEDPWCVWGLSSWWRLATYRLQRC